ncbi:MAG: hypothetical protein HN948_06770 [Clostridia bacterium]|jgi:hypothetical protein|nr:hypothetical protein [Clostridia bacterium]MBT7122694.1 hypothetical protein [Clostridia bacterium]
MKARSLVFWVAVAFAALALLITLIGFPFLMGAVWWALIGFVILVVGFYLKKL